jgi:predicted PolB exonuclease-like 3'-5' exonuclease
MTPVLAFDIETVPDVAGLRLLYDIDPKVPDADVAEFAFQKRRAQTGNDFLQLHLQRVVAISCAMREGDSFRCWTLGAEEDGEAELIRRFYDGIDRYTPQLVSWNGCGFDLPVLHYRSLVHGLSAPRYWDMGDDDRDFKFNNYLNRYHTRHLDVMDVLSLYQGRGAAPLDQLAKLLGFPGKLGMDGSKVWDAFQDGQIASIRNYCETDAVNTYLVYLRFQLLRGVYDAARYQRELELVRATLGKCEGAHWQEFLGQWKADPV